MFNYNNNLAKNKFTECTFNANLNKMSTKSNALGNVILCFKYSSKDTAT